MRLVLSVVVACALCSMGCAAVFKGSKQTVRFHSVPGQADVRVDNQYVGATPVDGEIDRNQSANIKVSKEGFTDQYVQIKRHPDTPWWFWDIGTCVVPVTLCIPLLVDAISGAWFSLDDDFRVKLDPVIGVRVAPTSAPPPPPSTTYPPLDDDSRP